VPPAPALPLWPLWLVLALVVGGGLVLVGRRRGWGRRPAAAVAPDDWAAAELDRVDRLGLPDAGEVERYHSLLSDVVRGYLEKRFRLQAPRQTTAEFLEAARTAADLPADTRGRLRAFLERCDLAKFARAGFTPDECRETGRMARELVRPPPPPAG